MEKNVELRHVVVTYLNAKDSPPPPFLIKHDAMKTYAGLEVWLYAFLISELNRRGWSVSRSGRFDPELSQWY
jgi:hypothetical protein